jgi:hypothetical protein
MAALSVHHLGRSNRTCVARRFRMASYFRMVDRLYSHMGCPVDQRMVHRGEEHTAFQILEHGSEFGTA